MLLRMHHMFKTKTKKKGVKPGLIDDRIYVFPQIFKEI